MIFYDKDEQEELLIPAGLGHSEMTDPNLKAENIRKGVEIYGVTGTYEGEKDDLSWIKRAQDGELTDLSEYTLPGGLAGNNYGMYNMFYNCKSLVTPPNLSGVTSVGLNGMNYMFNGCTSLTTPPDLSNVTSVGNGGMYGMFKECWNLTTAPDLSGVTSVKSNGMVRMFDTCVRLTSVDLSSVTSVGESGMDHMFINCRNLAEIRVGWSTWPTAIYALTNWVENVSPTGTFHCPPGLPEIFDIHHIPTGWTVVHDIV